MCDFVEENFTNAELAAPRPQKKFFQSWLNDLLFNQTIEPQWENYSIQAPAFAAM